MIPWLLPAALTLKGRLRDKTRRTAADGSAAALIEGGWWTAARLAAAGLRSTSKCSACKAAVGTLWHRLGDCSATKDEREGGKGCPQWLLRKGRAGLWDPLFSRGVPALPRVPAPPPQRVIRTMVEEVDGEMGVATGDIYTDGAMTGKWRRVMRGGWGVVVLVEGAQRVAWRMHGTCTELYPSILRAELTAVLNVLRIVVPPARIYVDNGEVVKGFEEGPVWCTAAGRDGGELWREVWERMEDIGGGVTVVKVKAHTDPGAVEEGIITERNRYGNMQADAEAKRGARLAETLSPVGAAKSELIKGMRWTGWVRRFAAVWAADHDEQEEEAARGARGADEGRPKGRAAAGLRHLVWERGLEWKCRRCGRLAATSLKRKDLQSSRCQGSAMGRLLQRTCQDAGAVERCCIGRREDMLSKGWRPRGGAEGGEEVRGATRPFDEEEGQMDQDQGSEDEGQGSAGGEGAMEGGEGSGLVVQGQGAAGGEGCGSNLAAAALAGGSGSASAAAGPTGSSARTMPLRGLAGPSTGEARNVRLRLSAGGNRAVEATRELAIDVEDFERGREGDNAGLLIEEEQFDEDPFGHVAGDLAQQPALDQHARQRDEGASRQRLQGRAQAARAARGGAAVECLERGREGGSEGLAIVEEQFDEDPFGHVAGDLARQPARRLRLRQRDEGAARQRPHAWGQVARAARGGKGEHHDHRGGELREHAAPGEHLDRGNQEARNVRPRLSAGEARAVGPVHTQTGSDEGPEGGRPLGEVHTRTQEGQRDEDPFEQAAADLAVQPAAGQRAATDAARPRDGDEARPRLRAPEGRAVRDAPGEDDPQRAARGTEQRELPAPGGHPDQGARSEADCQREEGDLDPRGGGHGSSGTRRAAAAETHGQRKRRRTDPGEGLPQGPAPPPEDERGERRASDQP